jgi:hypothetical protein
MCGGSSNYAVSPSPPPKKKRGRPPKEKPKKKRGRPPKEKPVAGAVAMTDDSDDDDSPLLMVPKKKRGRPPKIKAADEVEAMPDDYDDVDPTNCLRVLVAPWKAALDKKAKKTEDLEYWEALEPRYEKWLAEFSKATGEAESFLVSCLFFCAILILNTQAKFAQTKLDEVVAGKKLAVEEMKNATENVETCQSEMLNYCYTSFD